MTIAAAHGLRVRSRAMRNGPTARGVALWREIFWRLAGFHGSHARVAAERSYLRQLLGIGVTPLAGFTCMAHGAGTTAHGCAAAVFGQKITRLMPFGLREPRYLVWLDRLRGGKRNMTSAALRYH
jgi:hypothetical protein